MTYTGKQFAINAHRAVNHMYDDYLPYEFHLNLTAKYAMDYSFLVDPLDRELVINAAYCHDTIEDARVSYNDLKQAIGDTAADIVFAITNEKGKTRKERANDKYYEGIRNTSYAVYVKLCDRLANVSYGKLTGSRMFKMYQREQADFEARLAGEQLTKYQPLLIELRKLLRD
jgi:(p)ppGpp synthase/HD superfamily hydrolase